MNTKEKPYVYVLDKGGNPLMPTQRYGHVRRMLDSGKAKAVKTVPFTIQLTYEQETKITQNVRIGIDPGRTNIGISAVRDDGKCLFRANCETRNKEIPDLMSHRHIHRQASRRGERLRRKRRAKKNNTLMKEPISRKLPGYQDGVVHVKDIINTEARFNNRRRKPGKLTPTANQLLQSHQSLINIARKILPISSVSIEFNSFDFQKMNNSKIKPWEYGKGPLHGHGSVRKALKAQQNGVCLMCGKNPIAHDHHIIPRSRGGSNALENMAGLCDNCHEMVHKDEKAVEKLKELKAGVNKKYHALSVLNQIIERMVNWTGELFSGETYTVQGYSTKRFRDERNLSKDHNLDAYAICCSTFSTQVATDNALPPCYHLKQYRRQDRSRVKAQVFRSYYLDGEKVAQNRHKAIEATPGKGGSIKNKKQTFPALDDWFAAMVNEHGLQDAKRMRSNLTAKASHRRYNDTKREMPGSVFFHEGRRYVLSGRLTNGEYYRAYGCGNRNFPSKACTVYNNTGWVFVG